MFEGVIQDLIDELGRLPGIGPKSAQRLAFHILSMETADVTRIARTLEEVKARARFCEICGNLSESEQCRICRDPRRDESILCVVEEAKDVLAIEKTRAFRGRYHVLGGALNPIENIGPGELRIRELLQRLQNPGITEIIIATDPNMEGEATATYLVRQLTPLGVKVTKLATGVQLGGDLEYVDEVTIGRAIEGRRNQITD